MSREREDTGRQRQLIEVSGKWYFVTRERINVGPFPTKAHALAGAAELTQRLAQPLIEPRRTIFEFVRQRCR